jgi:hypothetical protein
MLAEADPAGLEATAPARTRDSVVGVQIAVMPDQVSQITLP